MKLSKTQFLKIGQSRGFLVRFLGPFLKNGLHLIGNVLKPLAKIVLIPLEFEAAAAADALFIRKFVCIRHDYINNF